MQIDSKKVDKIVMDTIKSNKLNKINDNLYLSNAQISILKKYNINYKDVQDISSLIFRVEMYLNDSYGYDNLYDLENLSRELSEYNYYYNTNK